MMILIAISAIVTLLSYLAIQHQSSKQHGQEQQNNAPLLFVIFLVTLIGGHWIAGWMGGPGKSLIGGGILGGGATSHEDALVQTLPNGLECLVGPAPF